MSADHHLGRPVHGEQQSEHPAVQDQILKYPNIVCERRIMSPNHPDSRGNLADRCSAISRRAGSSAAASSATPPSPWMYVRARLDQSSFQAYRNVLTL
jgi:hypothetical protein